MYFRGKEESKVTTVFQVSSMNYGEKSERCILKEGTRGHQQV